VNEHQISLVAGIFAIVASIIAIYTTVSSRGEKGGSQNQQILNAVTILENLKKEFDIYKAESGNSVVNLKVDYARLEERIKNLKEGSDGFSETTSQFAVLEPRLTGIEKQLTTITKDVTKVSTLATRWVTWCQILASRIQGSGRMKLELGNIPLPAKDDDD
jgi:hypothetical protein